MHFLISIILLFVQPKSEALFLKLKVGNQYTLTYTTKSEISTKTDKFEDVNKSEAKGTVKFRVDSFNDNVYTITTSYTDLRLTKISDYGNVNLTSSEKAGEKDYPGILSPLVNVSFTLKLTKYGNLVEVIGYEKIFENMSDKFPADLPGYVREEFTSKIIHGYSEGSFKSFIETNLGIFPTQSASVGNTWQSTTDMEFGFCQFNNQYTFKNADGTYIYLESVSQVEMLEDGFKDLYGRYRKYYVQGNKTASYVLHADSNWPVEVIQSMQTSSKITTKRSLESTNTKNYDVELQLNMVTREAQ